MRQTYTYTVSADGDRLDSFLAAQGDVKSRERAKAIIAEGGVTVNGILVTKPAAMLQANDIVELEYEDIIEPSPDIDPCDLSLKILYEDDACIVIDKPRGIAVHPASSFPTREPTILHGARFLLEKRGLPFSAAETLVHRLDKETTGCLLLAKTPQAHLALQKQFADRTVRKTYLALADGVPTHATATVDAPIGRSTHDRTKMSVHGAPSSAREAKTTYRVIDTKDGISLLECDLHTGRTHQIRVHLHSIGHPILGDPTYATSLSVKTAARLHIDILCLHAWTLVFQSVTAQEKISVTAPLPADMRDIMHSLGVRADGY